MRTKRLGTEGLPEGKDTLETQREWLGKSQWMDGYLVQTPMQQLNRHRMPLQACQVQTSPSRLKREMKQYCHHLRLQETIFLAQEEYQTVHLANDGYGEVPRHRPIPKPTGQDLTWDEHHIC